MKTINKIKKELNCAVKKYSFFDNVKYIETDIGNFIIKKNKDDSKLFINLERNDFDNYIDYKYQVEDYNLYPYLDDFDIDDDERGLDIVYLMSKLHNKTSYIKEITIDEIKDIYEKKKIEIKDLKEYYEYLRFITEEKSYLLPTEIYLLKNISIIFICLDLTDKYLEEWYNLMKNKKRIRVSLIHNNINLSHLIENNKPYLISWDNSKYDLPIYDFINFYKEEFDKLNFIDLLKIYKNNINISKEELLMLYIEILMPKKMILDNSEIKNIYDLTHQNIYLNKTYYLVLKDDKPNEKQEKA